MVRSVCFLALLLALAPLLFGCNGAQAPPVAGKLPQVMVSLPVTREITDSEEFTGRTEAKKTVDIRARVTGYLLKVDFTEGHEVNEGDVLFEIDPRTYQAQLHMDQADLVNKKALVTKTEALYRRSLTLVGKGASSQEDIDNQKGDWDVNQASVGQADAKVKMSQMYLDWCRVTAPISGRASRQMVDPGNLVKADDTVLTTIVSLDPIYVYFDVDERTVLKARRLVAQGKLKSARETMLPVYLGLADEDGFPHAGTINFVDNRVNAGTGTLRLRGEFPNTDRLLSAGLFARIQLPMGEPHQAVMVAEQALGTDQGQKFVYVVNDQNEVAYRRVKVGTLIDGLRVITEGLSPKERLIVNGLQRVKPGGKVEVKDVPMPAGVASSLPSQTNQTKLAAADAGKK
jgi:RND family efflux transporter MFP subunit